MPQTLCWTQRPIHGQADRLNAHSYITEGSGWPVFVKNELTKSRIHIHIAMPLTLSIIFKSASINMRLAVFIFQPRAKHPHWETINFLCVFRNQVKKILIYFHPNTLRRITGQSKAPWRLRFVENYAKHASWPTCLPPQVMRVILCVPSKYFDPKTAVSIATICCKTPVLSKLGLPDWC